jgi:peroxiredoxin
VFYPGDWDPVSQEQLLLYQECLPELRNFGATLIGISVDSVWSHVAFGRTLNPTFPLLSDFELKGDVSRTYGVYREAKGRSGRALFVLDTVGAVFWSRTCPTNLNPGIDGILTALERMQAEEAKQ